MHVPHEIAKQKRLCSPTGRRLGRKKLHNDTVNTIACTAVFCIHSLVEKTQRTFHFSAKVRHTKTSSEKFIVGGTIFEIIHIHHSIIALLSYKSPQDDSRVCGNIRGRRYGR